MNIRLTVIICFVTMALACVQCSANAEQGSHVDILKHSGQYSQDARAFNIHSITDPARAAEIRAYFQLDTLYSDTASTWDKTLSIAKFVATNVPHANQKVQPKQKNAIALWEYTKTVEPAFNCRLHSIMLFELLTSVGIEATYITCMPQDKHDHDCHVVNQVWLPELSKWVMIDSDMGGCYATDSLGNLLSLQEMREFYIQDKTICYHPQFGEAVGSDFWYYDYMAKNTYWFSCWETIHFDQEPSEGKNVGRYIHLVPEGYKPFGTNRKDMVTHNVEQFWAAPGHPTMK